jgi:hypothetical protein
VLGKDLPFKGASKIYNSDLKNIFQIDEYSQLTSMLDGIDKKATHVKVVIIDDMRFLMTKEYFSRAMETGFSKYTAMAKNFQSVLEQVQDMRKDLIVFGFLHEDDVINDKVIVSKEVKLPGQLIKKDYNPMEVMAICLWCTPEVGKEGTKYQFITNRRIIDGIQIPAKSPEGMFTDLSIPNDLSLVVKAIEEYY